MSKKSKPCSYTGHMHTMNRVNVEKKIFDFQSEQHKANLLTQKGAPVKHKNKGTDVALPQEQQKESPCKKCK